MAVKQHYIMNTKIISAVIVTAILFIGCSKKPTSTSPPATTSTIASADVDQFLATDWSARPLFPSGSPMNLSEEQFDALPIADEQAKSGELISQLATLKTSGVAVIGAGEKAASNGDVAEARKCFMSVKQCGEALDTTNYTKLVRLVGHALNKKADAELAKIGS